MTGPLFIFVAAAVCLAAEYAPWWGKVLLGLVALAAGAWTIRDAWRLREAARAIANKRPSRHGNAVE